MVRVIWDTTDFAYKGERADLGIIEGETVGFFGHFGLCVGADVTREPLGVVALHTYINADTKQRRGKTPAQIAALARATPREEKSSQRWESCALEAEKMLPAGTRAIHVLDQDGDDFAVFGALCDAGASFVIRASADRRTKHHGPTIADVLAAEPATIFRTVTLGHRGKTRQGARYQTRHERPAQLVIRWAPISMKRPSGAQTDVASLELFVVQVEETGAPPGEQPVSWTLVTSEQVTSLKGAEVIVDHYRARWLIEEFFKALKTGCGVEKRQLSTRDGLEKAVALFAPIAAEMLRLRHLAHVEAPPKATDFMPREDIDALRALLAHRRPHAKLPPKPTARDVLHAIAALGGHLKNNGEPGWLVIGRGYEDFRLALEVWNLAKRSDQS